MRRAALLALALGLLAGACGGDDGDSASATTAPGAAAAGPTTTKAPSDDDAAEAVQRQFKYLTDGQYGRAWEEIHPAQQGFIPRALYVRCSGDRLGSIQIVDIDVKEVFHEPSAIEGTDLEPDSVAITLALKYKAGALPEQSDTETFHEFFVDGQWRFSVTGAESYKAGECPE